MMSTKIMEETTITEPDDDDNENKLKVMEDIMENPVIVNEYDDEDDDEWDQNSYNFVDLSDTARESKHFLLNYQL